MHAVMTSRLLAPTLIVLSLAFAGCFRTSYRVEGAGATSYTLTNMHADRRGRVISTNYTGGARIPICTPIVIDRVNSRQVRFHNAQTGQRYTYIMHRSARTPIDQHVTRYFGNGCPNITAMSPADQSGIQSGRVYQGMTKQGVILAIGYPPEHRTPTLEQDVWRYWGTRNRSYEVYFSGGVVTGIRQ